MQELTNDAVQPTRSRHADRGRNRHFDVFSPRVRATTPTGIYDSRPRQRIFTYGQGIAKVLAAAGLNQIDVVESKGSNENLSSVDASPTVIGMAFWALQLMPRTAQGSPPASATRMFEH